MSSDTLKPMHFPQLSGSYTAHIENIFLKAVIPNACCEYGLTGRSQPIPFIRGGGKKNNKYHI